MHTSVKELSVTEVISNKQVVKSKDLLSLEKKITKLTHSAKAIFISDFASAIFKTIDTFLKPKDHIILSYTYAKKEYAFLLRYCMDKQVTYSFFTATDTDITTLLKPNTRAVFLQNPDYLLLQFTDIKKVTKTLNKLKIPLWLDASLATVDATYFFKAGASLVFYNVTSYLGGHNDIAGVVLCAKHPLLINAIDTSGVLPDTNAAFLLDRSLKTLMVRTKYQSRSAKKIARILERHTLIDTVYYPGLKSSDNYKIAKSQIKVFGSVLTIVFKKADTAILFEHALSLFKTNLPIAGVSSTLQIPTPCMHKASTSKVARAIATGALVQISIGVEPRTELLEDITKALDKLA